jgi:hypothetical protein
VVNPADPLPGNRDQRVEVSAAGVDSADTDHVLS